MSWAIEFCADVCAGAALAHNPCIRARTQGQLQSIDQDGLACPGFASQHGEAGLKFKFQRLDNHKITQRDPPECHGQEPPSFQRSFLRSVAK